MLATTDFNAAAAQTYRRTFQDHTFLEGDIREISGRDISREVGIRRRELDLLIGAPPARGSLSLEAAEHVNDIEAIGNCFFPASRNFAKSRPGRTLKKALKPARDRVSAIANAIKHNQSRLRLFSLDFVHDATPICLHGFFVEGYSRDVVCPSPVIHASGERIIAVPSFLWSVVVYLVACSDALTAFLSEINAFDSTVPQQPILSRGLADAVVAPARLPIYSIDEVHPFERTRVKINADDSARLRLQDTVYGSIVNRWSKSTAGGFGTFQLAYEGDGASKGFQTLFPTTLRLQHWD